MPQPGWSSWNGVFPTPEIIAHLNRLVGEAARLGPVLPVALLFVVALAEAVFLPRSMRVKVAAAIVVVLCGLGAGALLRWEQRTNHETAAGQAADQAAAESAVLKGLWAQLDALSQTLPSPSKEPAGKFDSPEDALASLSAKVATIGDQVTALKAGAIGRSIDPATAMKLADYLRQYGSYRAVVTCAPGDVEAYAYATQLVGILKAAGWDANGPEATANAVEGPAMGIMVLMRDPTAPDAAKILLDAFNQENIPHRPGIAADETIPDAATVELYVAKKP
jgi:hypothetical protein